MVVGSVEVEPLTDAVGVLGALAELCPGTPAAGWDAYRELYPDVFAGDDWRTPCTCYLVRSGGRTLLVDTGVGPPGLWDWEPEWEGGLLRALTSRGVEPADVDAVLITHVHFDHVGWNTDRDGELVFPRARFLLAGDAIAAARARADRVHIQRCVLSLLDRGVVDETEPGAEVVPGVRVVVLPGHDPGHVGLRIGDAALLIGDAAAHPALLDDPERVFVLDDDHERAAATRRELVAEVADANVLVISGHHPGTGVGRVVTRDGRVVWEEAAEAR